MKDIKQLKLSNGKTYELCLTAKSAARVEREIGKSILEVLGKSAPDANGKVTVPTMDDLANILAAEILNEEVSKDEALKIMDDYFDDGGDYGSLFLLITESLGFLKVAPATIKK